MTYNFHPDAMRELEAAVGYYDKLRELEHLSNNFCEDSLKIK